MSTLTNERTRGAATDTDSFTSSSPRPKLAFVYNPRSFGAMALADAANGLCDLVWVVDTSHPEVESMTRLLRRFGPCVDVAGLSIDEAASKIAEHAPQGILSLADDSLLWTAEVAIRLGLTFLSPATAARLTDKHVQRQALREGGLSVPRSWLVRHGEEETAWSTIASEASFPAVLKPRLGAGSRDTIPITTPDELRALGALPRSFDDHPRDFVLEEFIPDATYPAGGEGFAGYVSVESFVSDGHVTHLAINGRMPPAPPFRETGFFIPSALDNEQERAVLEVASRALTAMGVVVGCLHTEIKLTPTGPIVIEVNGRIGGGVPQLLASANGVRMLSLAMRLALGEEVVCDEMPPCNRLAYLFYVQAPEELRTITAVEGLNELQKVAGVDEIILNRGPGQNVDWREGNLGYVFSVAGTVADHVELRHVYGLVASLVRISGD